MTPKTAGGGGKRRKNVGGAKVALVKQKGMNDADGTKDVPDILASSPAVQSPQARTPSDFHAAPQRSTDPTLESYVGSLHTFSLHHFKPDTKVHARLTTIRLMPEPKLLEIQLIVVTGKHQGPVGLFASTGMDCVAVGARAASVGIAESVSTESMSGQYVALVNSTCHPGDPEETVDPHGLLDELQTFLLPQVDFVVEFRDCHRGQKLSIPPSLTITRKLGSVSSTQGMGEELNSAFGLETVFLATGHKKHSIVMTSKFAAMTDAQNIPRYTISQRTPSTEGAGGLYYSIVHDAEQRIWRGLLAAGILCIQPPGLEENIPLIANHFLEPFEEDDQEDDGYNFAPSSGMCELFVKAEQHVQEDELICKIHSVGLRPVCLRAQVDGIVVAITSRPIVHKGDFVCLVTNAKDQESANLLGPGRNDDGTKAGPVSDPANVLPEVSGSESGDQEIDGDIEDSDGYESESY